MTEHLICEIEAWGRSGIVFFDEAWSAYGWRTDDFTNGPYDTRAEAESALRDELEEVGK